MVPVNLLLFNVSANYRLDLADSMRFEAETHFEAEERAHSAGEEWVKSDPTGRRYFTVPVRDV
jgi:hypothetical protein